MKFYDAFCGIGGFHEGIMQAHPDWECAGACDIDKDAKQIYAKHFPKVDINDDIRKVDRLPEGTDLLCGGFPCQSFSIAGKRGGLEDTRGTLFFEVARLLRISKPRWLFLENVKGLLNHDRGRTFGTILYTLGELGYWWEYQVLNSKDFGVPQNRERVFIIGHIAGGSSKPIFPLGESGKVPDTQERSEREGGEGVWCEDCSSTIDSRYGALRNAGETYIQQINNPSHAGDRVYSSEGLAPSVRARARSDQYASAKVMLPFNDNNSKGFSLAEPFDGIRLQYPKSKTARGRVIKQNSQALQASGAGGVLLPDAKIRRLTEVECERLQGFPDGWTEGISATQRYKCLGNAVTVNVIRAIAERIEG